VLYWTLTELRAQVWGRMGLTRKSLTAYQGILAHACESSEQGSSAADQASLLYTCGKLSVSLNQCEEAVDYYLRELEMTVKQVKAEGNSQNNLAVARIYHELARSPSGYAPMKASVLPRGAASGNGGAEGTLGCHCIVPVVLFRKED
jgi:hypothetical protein